MTDHFITLSTTDLISNAGIVKLRHADVNSQNIVAQIVENDQPKSFEGLQPYFCLMAQEVTGQGVTEESVASFDAKKGTLTYNATIAGNYAKVLNFNNPGRYINNKWVK